MPKIEVESEALDSLKAMAQRLQNERDELLETLEIARFWMNGAGDQFDYDIDFVDEIIDKCTAKPEVLE